MANFDASENNTIMTDHMLILSSLNFWSYSEKFVASLFRPVILPFSVDKEPGLEFVVLVGESQEDILITQSGLNIVQGVSISYV